MTPVMCVLVITEVIDVHYFLKIMRVPYFKS